MARPSAFYKGGNGGGLWNGEMTIVGYYYTTVFPFGTPRPAKKGSTFNPLYAVLKVRKAGAEADQEKVLKAGSADDFTISADKMDITPNDGRRTIGMEWATFISTLCEAGFDEARLPEDPTSNDFRAIIGTRIVMKDRINEDLTKKIGKRKDAKTGREYSRTDLVVDQVLEMPKAAGRSGAPTPAASDVDGLARATLLTILDEGGPTPKAKLKLRVFGKIDNAHPQRSKREAVVARLEDADFLAALAEDGVITFDAASKQQTVALAN